jgi:segregation and condensation protein B
MEVLAIIAYKQPITRAEIDNIRGVDCGGVIDTLTDRKFIKIVGRKESLGRPLLYGTTQEFLRHFGLSHLSELPIIENSETVVSAEEQKTQELPFEENGENAVQTISVNNDTNNILEQENKTDKVNSNIESKQNIQNKFDNKVTENKNDLENSQSDNK